MVLVFAMFAVPEICFTRVYRFLTLVLKTKVMPSRVAIAIVINKVILRCLGPSTVLSEFVRHA